MKNKIIGFLKRIFGKITKRPENKKTPVRDVSETGTAEPSPCIVRIRRILSDTVIRPVPGNASGVWYIKAESFTDAYRLLLRLGRQEQLVCLKRGGRVRYRLNLPDGNGNVTLTDKVGNRRNTLAVMSFCVPEIPEIREIRLRKQPNRKP